MTKKLIYTILLVIWMVVIFLFSNQNGIKSEATSDSFVAKIVDAVTNNEIKESKKDKIITNTRFVVRKFAHFTIYLILGILAYLTLSSYRIPRVVIYSILLCFIYACSDEIHQMFLSGRTARILDVIIDISGSIVGIIISSLKR